MWTVDLPSSIRRRTYRAMTHWSNNGGKVSVMMNLDPPKMDPLGYSSTKVQQLPANSLHAKKSHPSRLVATYTPHKIPFIVQITLNLQCAAQPGSCIHREISTVIGAVIRRTHLLEQIRHETESLCSVSLPISILGGSKFIMTCPPSAKLSASISILSTVQLL